MLSYADSLEWCNTTKTYGWEEAKCLHLLPLTDLVGECGQTKATKAKGTKKAPWHWDEIHQQAFNLVKTTIACDALLAYPDYCEKFEIYTDASNSQIGSVITQRNRPLAFFSRKLSDTQKGYNTTKKELLAIVETLKEFKVMLWGQSIVVYTDHKNLIYDAQQMSSDRVYRWRLLLEATRGIRSWDHLYKGDR